jgi:hypothetical protein
MHIAVCRNLGPSERGRSLRAVSRLNSYTIWHEALKTIQANWKGCVEMKLRLYSIQRSSQL